MIELYFALYVYLWIGGRAEIINLKWQILWIPKRPRYQKMILGFFPKTYRSGFGFGVGIQESKREGIFGALDIYIMLWNPEPIV